jgi:hypothetical protein
MPWGYRCLCRGAIDVYAVGLSMICRGAIDDFAVGPIDVFPWGYRCFSVGLSMFYAAGQSMCYAVGHAVGRCDLITRAQG